MSIAASELILNPDGSIYHLNLLPEDIANTIITVGDPDRVDEVSKYFDTITLKKQKREFKTHTGVLNGKRISVISTGIGAGNVDIVLNELDALVNVDFKQRTPKENLTKLRLFRIGTSGALQADIAVDSFLVSSVGIGFDNLLHFYKDAPNIWDRDLSEAFVEHTKWNPENSLPYAVPADRELFGLFSSEENFIQGITTTNIGFYGPQGREIRLEQTDSKLNETLGNFIYKGMRITNLEMETASIYGMAKLLGHKAISLNAILANRTNGSFSDDPESTIDSLIKTTLNIITL